MKLKKKVRLAGASLLAAGAIGGTSLAGAHTPYARWSVHNGLITKAYNSNCYRTSNSQGTQVKFWQLILWSAGRLSSANPDGIFGSSTLTATNVWQLDHGLSSDGCVGTSTWYAAQYHTGHATHMNYQGKNTYCEGSAYCWTEEDWKFTEGSSDRTFQMVYGTLSFSWDFQQPNGSWYRIYNH